MEQRVLRIEIPEGINFEHAYHAITDALYLPDNVTQAEYNLIEKILSDLRDYGSKKIAIIWSTEDVHATAANMEDTELTEEEAEEVLSMVEDDHDANIGVNWNVLEYHIQNVKHGA